MSGTQYLIGILKELHHAFVFCPPLIPFPGGRGEDYRAIHLIQDRWSYPAVPLFDDINVAYCLFL